jgi:hypothetical protein
LGNKEENSVSQETMKKEVDEQKSPEKPIPDLYANSTEISISIYDVQIDFGIRSSTEETSKTVAIVRMSPQHALAMARLLLKNLREYERQVGKINLPRDLLEKLEVGEGSSDELDS